MNSIAVLVLAAGNSSRMKDIKQLLKINNKTLLETTLETAKKVVSENVFCVLGANAKKIKKKTSTKNVKFIFNKNFDEGLSSSIICGINHIKKEPKNYNGILILLADQPEVSREYLKKLISLFNTNLNKIVASSYYKSVGVPAIFPKKYFDKLKLLKGDKGAKEFLQNHKTKIIKLERNQPFKDIDTQEDYKLYINSI